MNYQIGDTVVHWTHGLGKITAIEERQLAGEKQQYYVVEVKQYKLWVPVSEALDGSIRYPTEISQFTELFNILRARGTELPENQYQRKLVLRERMQKRTLGDICSVIRDLKERSWQHTLNQNDLAVLMRSEEYLLDEWVFSKGVEYEDAKQELETPA